MSHFIPMGPVLVDTRPEYTGPGYWKALHQWAYVHDTSTITGAREMFIDNLIRGTAGHFDCLECRGHALEHMTKTDPISDILKLPKTSPDGSPLMVCSAWAYRFHEAVNKRLNKPEYQRPTYSQLQQFLAELREGKGCQNCGPITNPDEVTKNKKKIQRQIID